MKRFQEQLKKKADSIRMTTTERADLRERLVAYMEYHPMPQTKTSKKRVDPATIPSEAYTTIKIDVLSLSRYLGAFAVLFLIVVPIVAERSVPGDVLYPVKVGFNEEVRGTLALSPYQKVEWETTRLERRIAEARLLADAGKLTPEVEAEVTKAIKGHSDAAQKGIAALSQTNGEEAALAGIAFTSALEVQSEFLEGEHGTTTGHSVLALASVVDEARLSAEATTATQQPVSYPRLLAQTEAETTRAYEFVKTIGRAASADEQRDIERRLSDINTKMETAIGTEDEEEARDLLTVALSDTRKLISFMTNIDVREAVTVEEVVPVTLTEDEKTSEVRDNKEKTTKLLAAVAERTDNLPVDVLEKVNLGVDMVNELLAKASSTEAAGEIDAAVAASAEAYTLASDLNLMTEPYRLDALVETEVPTATSTATTTEPAATSTESVAEEVIEETPETEGESPEERATSTETR